MKYLNFRLGLKIIFFFFFYKKLTFRYYLLNKYGFVLSGQVSSLDNRKQYP